MSDCLIIGGGIIGMMTAKTLSDEGFEVILLDKQQLGRAASWAAGGIISPLYPWRCDEKTLDLSFKSQSLYPQICAKLRENVGIDPEYRQTGLMMIDEFDSKTAQKWLKSHNIKPTINSKGAFFKDLAQIRTPRLLRALQAYLISKNVKIIDNSEVLDLVFEGDKVLGVKTNKSTIYADMTVVCAGAWSKFGGLEQIYPVKGQMIALKTKPDTVPYIILENERYLIPRKDGVLLVGSTLEEVGFNTDTDSKSAASLHNFAIRHFPSIQGAKITHHWAGLRPASRSGKVILGRSEKYRQLLFNTGHFRYGLTMAPASAAEITTIIKQDL